MLVLSRSEGQAVVVIDQEGNELEITVVSVDGGRVRIGFEGPRVFTIYREEVRERMRADAGISVAGVTDGHAE